MLAAFSGRTVASRRCRPTGPKQWSTASATAGRRHAVPGQAGVAPVADVGRQQRFTDHVADHDVPGERAVDGDGERQHALLGGRQRAATTSDPATRRGSAAAPSHRVASAPTARGAARRGCRISDQGPPSRSHTGRSSTTPRRGPQRHRAAPASRGGARARVVRGPGRSGAGREEGDGDALVDGRPPSAPRAARSARCSRRATTAGAYRLCRGAARGSRRWRWSRSSRPAGSRADRHRGDRRGQAGGHRPAVRVADPE